MAEIILPDNLQEEENEETLESSINYNPTEYDEQEFFLMYHLKMSPTEVKAVNDSNPEKLKWIIGRFMVQKQMEQRAMQEHQRAAAIMHGIDPSKLRND